MTAPKRTPTARRKSPGARFDPWDCGWQVGTSRRPARVPLWIRYDRTTGVIGAQGSGKSLDVLFPALLGSKGAALTTLTKLQDYALTVTARARRGPTRVLDPFELAAGEPALVWDPLEGCVSAEIAGRRAKAFAAGTIKGALARGTDEAAARYYATEAIKVLTAYFHAAALTGRTLHDVLAWVADPRKTAETVEEILIRHPHAEEHIDGQFHGAILNEDHRTSGNTISTVQQAMGMFFVSSFRDRCVPTPDRPATNIAELIRNNGTIYLLGREDPYSAASPLMTAVAEHVLDVARAEAARSPHGKLCPSFLAVLDELPSTAPLPSLLTSMANDRDLGLCYLWAAQDEEQLRICFGDTEADSLIGLTNNLIAFGGGKNLKFYTRLSELIGPKVVTRTTTTSGAGGRGRSRSRDKEPVLRADEIRKLPPGQALIVAENAPPIIAGLHRCITGPTGQQLLTGRDDVLQRIEQRRNTTLDLDELTRAAHQAAAKVELTPKPTNRQPST
ncbi:MAG: TraM recognition domain-containing protein [Jatrophihabitantaceae bacterium]